MLSSPERTLLRELHPLSGGEDDYDELLERIGDASVVLLGEASHGTHEFYRERARITRRLIEEHGFRGVAVEADWPDAYRVNRYVHGAGEDADAEEALRGFRRFPTWMWRNAEVLDFVGWLRARNERLGAERAASFFGLDLYSLHASVAEVIAYLERRRPGRRRARPRALRLLRGVRRRPGLRPGGDGRDRRALPRGGRQPADRAAAARRRLPAPRRDRRRGRAVLRRAERAPRRQRRGVLPLDVRRPRLLLEPARPPHDGDAGTAAGAPQPPRRVVAAGRLGAQLARRRRADDRDEPPRRAQPRPAGARALGRGRLHRRLHHLHRHRHRRLGLGRAGRAQAGAAGAAQQLRAPLPRARRAALPARPGTARRRPGCWPSRGWSGRSASSTGPRPSAPATTSRPASRASSTPSSTSTRRGRWSRSSAPPAGKRASRPRPTRRAL